MITIVVLKWFLLYVPLVQSLLYGSFPSPAQPETQTLENKHSLLQAFLFPHQRNLQGKKAIKFFYENVSNLPQ